MLLVSGGVYTGYNGGWWWCVQGAVGDGGGVQATVGHGGVYTATMGDGGVYTRCSGGWCVYRLQ